ncbi:MAG: penicillin-binding protein 1A [Thiogranum sp.]
MTTPIRILRFLLATGFAIFTAAILVLAAAYFYVAPDLPDIDRLKDVKLQVPLRVYAADGELMAEFGEQRRIPVAYDELPQMVIDAILATEDDRFFEHPGVDYQGLVRAAVQLARTGEKRQGGSTITMQVARNFFLSSEKTYLRKLTEIFLALKIERYLSKEEILELYLNKIYFGHRAYGVGAAAEVYYGRTIDQLSLAQVATIAGLPKAPSSNNPVTNPERALERRNYVLGRMYELGFIDVTQYQAALEEPDDASLHTATIGVEAPYVAEMVRSYMVDTYGEDAYHAGYSVTTTLDTTRQRAAVAALRSDLLAYDRRHGYRGPEAHVELSAQQQETDYQKLLESRPSVGGLHAALVLAVEGKSARVFVDESGPADLGWDALSWARKFVTVNQRGPEPKQAADILAPGDIVRVEATGDGNWQLAQVPGVSGALVSLRPQDGALQALVGGFDFFASKFNRATQAQRQPGSSFKPFIYSAALDRGYTLASVFNDAPVVFDDPSLETTWRPENYSGKFYGPTRVREALTHSRNLVSIRLLRAIGPAYAVDYVQRFGFRAGQVPKDLSLALGSGSATPMEMARAYSVWANGGFLVTPYFIQEVHDSSGETLFSANPAIACPDCEEAEDEPAAGESPAPVPGDSEPTDTGAPDPTQAAAAPGAEEERGPVYAERVVDYDNVYLMTSLMQDVIKRGTGRRARSLGRTDLAGKTGTTNDQRDAWFCGFDTALVTTVWVGFDQVQPLGNGETGSQAALPMWIAYMKEALANVPLSSLPQPPDLVTVRIDAKTGLRLPPGERGGLFELFRPGHVPERYSRPEAADSAASSGEESPEPLF